MTQVENEPKKAKKGQEKPSTINIRKMFADLSQHDQVAVTTFFNLHNAAIFVYNDLSQDAKAYCEYCIKLSQENVNV